MKLCWVNGCENRGNNDNLWRQIILAKYKLGRNGWDILGSYYRHSGLWRGIASTKETFLSCIRFKVGSGAIFSSDMMFGPAIDL